MSEFLSEWRLVLVKDLRLEMRSRVGLAQVLPFAVLVLFLFAFALDPDGEVLQIATPGLFWVTVLFSAVLILQRTFALEADDGVLDALRLSGMSPAAIFLGKVSALIVQLLVLELVLALGVIVLYDVRFSGLPLLVVVSIAATTGIAASGAIYGALSSRLKSRDTLLPVLLLPLLAAVSIAATAGIAASGAIYGALSSRLKSRDTLLPILLLPLLAPVLISATRGFEIGLRHEAGGGWSWVGLLSVFAGAYLVLGAVLFRPLLEDA